jgi:hypothetical protein
MKLVIDITETKEGVISYELTSFGRQEATELEQLFAKSLHRSIRQDALPDAIKETKLPVKHVFKQNPSGESE